MAQGGQSKQGGGCLGIFLVLVVVAAIIEYWEIALAVAGGVAILFALGHYLGDEGKPPNWSAAGGWSVVIAGAVVATILVAGGDEAARRGEQSASSEAGPSDRK